MNKSGNKNLRLDALAAFSGFLIAMQARANGELSHRLESAPQAALISFSSGLFFITLFALFSKRVHGGIKKLTSAVKAGEIPKWRLLAGALGGSFVAIQSSIVFLIGVATFSVASIAGQTAVSLIVDRIGLTGGGPKPISFRRVMAALITVLAFPGIFRGLLDAGAKKITDELLVACAKAIVSCVSEAQLNASFIVPSVFDPSVVKAVASAVKERC